MGDLEATTLLVKPVVEERRGTSRWVKTGVAALGVFAVTQVAAAVTKGASAPSAPSVALPLFNEMQAEKVKYAEIGAAEVVELWKQYKSDQGRTFDDLEEDFRFEVFKLNLKYIDELNTMHPFALFGLTKYADRTEEERQLLKQPAEFSDYSAMKDTAMPPGHPMREAAERGPAHAVAKAQEQREAARRRLAARLEGLDDDATQSSEPVTEIGGLLQETGQVDWVTYDDCAACATFVKAGNYSESRTPQHFDWRSLNAVTDVKNQMACSADWAMAAVQDIESSAFLGREMKAFDDADDADGLAALSTQQLIACDPTDKGCQGGYTFQGYQYVMEFGGLVHESAYSFEGLCADAACAEATAHPTPTCDRLTVKEQMKQKLAATVGGWQMVAMGADYEHLLKVAMLRNGPIAAVMNSYGMEYYVKGVMGCSDDSYCEAGHIDHNEYCDENTLDHSVVIVGYGVEDGMDYWMVKNSWGTEWGTDGYYRIVRGHNHCGISNFATHSVYKHAEFPHAGKGSSA